MEKIGTPEKLILAVIVLFLLLVALAYSATMTYIDEEVGEPPEQMDYHLVLELNGTDDSTSDTFRINGSKFMIKWNASPEFEEYALFAGRVYYEHESEFVESFEGLNGTTVIHTSGDLFIRVIASSLTRWEIERYDFVAIPEDNSAGTPG